MKPANIVCMMVITSKMSCPIPTGHKGLFAVISFLFTLGTRSPVAAPEYGWMNWHAPDLRAPYRAVAVMGMEVMTVVTLKM